MESWRFLCFSKDIAICIMHLNKYAVLRRNLCKRNFTVVQKNNNNVLKTGQATATTTNVNEYYLNV